MDDHQAVLGCSVMNKESGRPPPSLSIVFNVLVRPYAATTAIYLEQANRTDDTVVLISTYPYTFTCRSLGVKPSASFAWTAGATSFPASNMISTPVVGDAMLSDDSADGVYTATFSNHEDALSCAVTNEAITVLSIAPATVSLDLDIWVAVTSIQISLDTTNYNGGDKVKVIHGEDSTFNCDVIDVRPPASFEWKIETNIVTEDDPPGTIDMAGSSTGLTSGNTMLTMSIVWEDHGMKVACSATNDALADLGDPDVGYEIELDVLVKPVDVTIRYDGNDYGIAESTANQNVVEVISTHSETFECFTISVKGEASFEWKLDSTVTANDGGFPTNDPNAFEPLRFDGATQVTFTAMFPTHHQVILECKTWNEPLPNGLVTSVLLDVLVKPTSVTMELDSTVLTDGQDVQMATSTDYILECKTLAVRPTAMFEWTVIYAVTGEVAILSSDTPSASCMDTANGDNADLTDSCNAVTINPSIREIGATVTCKTWNKALPKDQALTTSVVLNPVNVMPKVPDISVAGDSLINAADRYAYAISGESITFTCSSQAAIPAASLSWSFDGSATITEAAQTIEASNTRFINLFDTSLDVSLTPVYADDDQATLTCSATNDAQITPLTATITLLICVPPDNAIIEFNDADLTDGQTIIVIAARNNSFKCKTDPSDGIRPESDFRWTLISNAEEEDTDSPGCTVNSDDSNLKDCWSYFTFVPDYFVHHNMMLECEIVHKAITGSNPETTAVLDVWVAPSTMTLSSNDVILGSQLEVIEGQDYTFTCDVPGIRPNGSIQWYFDDDPAPANSTTVVDNSAQNADGLFDVTSDLSLTAALQHHRVKLTCIVTNDALPEGLSIHVILELWVIPTAPIISLGGITFDPASEECHILLIPESYNFTCVSTRHRPEAVLEWTWLNSIAPSDMGILHVPNAPDDEILFDAYTALTISPGPEDDRQILQCSVFNDAQTSSISSSLEICIHKKPSVPVISMDSITYNNEERVTLVGGNAYTFECFTSGAKPAVQFTWSMNANQVQADDGPVEGANPENPQLIDSISSLTITPTIQNHGQLLICNVTNDAVNSINYNIIGGVPFGCEPFSTYVYLDVIIAPTEAIISVALTSYGKDSEVALTLDETYTFSCMVPDIRPGVMFEWTLGDTKLNVAGFSNILNSIQGPLVISMSTVNLTIDMANNEQVLQCKATNQALVNNIETSVVFQVRSPPADVVLCINDNELSVRYLLTIILESSLAVTCKVTGAAPEATIIWLFGNEILQEDEGGTTSELTLIPTLDDTGKQLRCVAKNVVGQNIAEITLNVIERQEFGLDLGSDGAELTGYGAAGLVNDSVNYFEEGELAITLTFILVGTGDTPATFTAGLFDSSSAEFVQLGNWLASALYIIFKDNRQFLRLVLTSFQPGSVHVNTMLVFRNTDELDVAGIENMFWSAVDQETGHIGLNLYVDRTPDNVNFEEICPHFFCNGNGACRYNTEDYIPFCRCFEGYIGDKCEYFFNQEEINDSEQVTTEASSPPFDSSLSTGQTILIALFSGMLILGTFTLAIICLYKMIRRQMQRQYEPTLSVQNQDRQWPWLHIRLRGIYDP